MLLLHHAAGAGQEVLDVGHRCLGEVGHGAIAATRGTVVQEVTDPCGRVLLQEVLVGTLGFL